MATVPHCYIHIGAPKTGSTLIQKACFEHRAVLLGSSILYPDVSLRGYGHHDVAFLLGGGYPDWATSQPRSLEDLGGELAAAVRSHRGSILLSSEDFYLCPNPEGLKEFLGFNGALNDRTPRIVVYVRRQDDAHESWYNQTIKAQGYAHDIDACVRRFWDLFDYEKQLGDWAAAFGEENLIVRIFDSAEFANGDLLCDFLASIEADVDLITAGEAAVNNSLNRDLLNFQRVLNRLPLGTPEKRKFHKELMELSRLSRGSELFDERPFLDDERRAEIMDEYARSNRNVAERFFSRAELFNEAATVPRELSSQAPREFSIEKLTAIVGWLLLRGESR